MSDTALDQASGTSFYLLDTDHFSEFERGSAAGSRFRSRMSGASAMFFTSIITVEEVLQGWMSELKRAKSPPAEIQVYQRLQRSIKALQDWDVLAWDEEAVCVCQSLRARKIRMGTMDMKIASIALAYDATILTRNSVDFAKVPGLRIENWLD